MDGFAKSSAGLQQGMELSKPTSPKFRTLSPSGWELRLPATTTSFTELEHGSDYSGSFAGSPPPEVVAKPLARKV